jgi:hypothetical protein
MDSPGAISGILDPQNGWTEVTDGLKPTDTEEKVDRVVVGVAPVLQEQAKALSVELGNQFSYHDAKGVAQTIKEPAFINLTLVDPNLQGGVIRSLEKFHENYPKLHANITCVDPDSTVGRAIIRDPKAVMAATTPHADSGTVYLNSDFFSSKATLDKALGEAQAVPRMAESSRYFGPTSPLLTKGAIGSARQIVDHELGHALMGQLGEDTTREIYKQVQGNLSTGTMANQIRTTISKYATTSMDEFFAEAINQAQGSAPSKLAKQVNDLVKDAYHKEYG